MNTNTMQIHVTGRHLTVTDAIKEYAIKKLESIDLDFPKVMDARIILDVEKYRHRCEIMLVCTSRIHLEAVEESDNMYASIDVCVDKLARRMRKCKTKVQRHNRQRKQKQPVQDQDIVILQS